MNSNIVGAFETLIHKTSMDLKKTKDTSLRFKITSYKKTIKLINSLPFEISKGEDLKDIKGIGKTTIKKINEIIESGTLTQIKDLNSTVLAKAQELSKLQKITGIGPVKATQLFDLGITLDVLTSINFKKITATHKTILQHLTHHQTLGVKYFSDLESKIPHSEIQKIEKYLLKLIKKIPNLKMTICGSYRRKKTTSGDIDVLLYHDKDENVEFSSYLTEFLSLLVEKKFLTDHLTSIDNPTKYMGFCKMSTLNRRIDIRLVPKSSFPTALLYFTGSGEFNVNMRKYALSKGFSINEYGIFKLTKTGKKKFKIKTNLESDIFKILGLDYVEPHDRLPSYKF